jgi:putative hydrolase of the HAD superfamily
MIKAIIFDLDNTLIDFMKMKYMSMEAAAAAMIDAGLKHNKDRIMRKLFRLYDQYGWEDQTIFQKYLMEEAGKVEYRVLANAINAYRRVRHSFLEPFPHVMETLLELRKKGIKLAIVSDAPKLKAWIRLTAMKIDRFFDVIVGFEDTKQRKPSKKPFEVALKKLRVKADMCLMIGDMPERDIKGAKKLGMQSCFAKYGCLKCPPRTNADYEIGDISELLKIVGK